jgi:hypothetical protein
MSIEPIRAIIGQIAPTHPEGRTRPVQTQESEIRTGRRRLEERRTARATILAAVWFVAIWCAMPYRSMAHNLAVPPIVMEVLGR